MRKIGTALIASVLSLAMAPAFAADDAPRLDTNGEVMVSNGDAYVSAADGQVIRPGQRIMVHEGSSATVTYDNGCSISFIRPGTYPIPAVCVADSARRAQYGTDWVAVGVVAGVVALVAAGLESMGDENPDVPPLSQ